jgi:hypothetical protein
MATTVLHVGDDPCHRIPVMEQRGLSVVQSECSVGGLQHVFTGGMTFSALTFHNETYTPADAVVSTARTLSTAPFVLFHNPFVRCDQSVFDLVIPVHTSPVAWLKSLEQAIQEAKQLRKMSLQLRQDCADVRAISRKLQIAANRNKAKNIDVDALWRKKPEE